VDVATIRSGRFHLIISKKLVRTEQTIIWIANCGRRVLIQDICLFSLHSNRYSVNNQMDN
jgi:hypothetical protein